MLHWTICNDDFSCNTALQHCCDIVSHSCIIDPTLQPCVGRENFTQKVNLFCFKPHHFYSNSFNWNGWNVKCWRFFQELNSKGLYLSSLKEKENRCLVFTSSRKREIKKFHVVVVQRRQRNVQKSVMHVQSCCFAYLNLLLLCRSRCHRHRRCLRCLVSFVKRVSREGQWKKIKISSWLFQNGK